MALMARQVTGRGQFIDAALYECAFNFMEPWVPAFEKTGHVANRTGSRLPGSNPNNLYPTGDGSFILITAMADSLFKRLAGVMEQPELADDPLLMISLASGPVAATHGPAGISVASRRLMVILGSAVSLAVI